MRFAFNRLARLIKARPGTRVSVVRIPLPLKFITIKTRAGRTVVNLLKVCLITDPFFIERRIPGKLDPTWAFCLVVRTVMVITVACLSQSAS